MPELDAERREQLAEALHTHHLPYGGGVCACGWAMTMEHFGMWSEAHRAHLADALAPLIAGWLAEAWDEGYGAGDGDQMDAYWGQDHPPTRNPYRAGEPT